MRPETRGDRAEQGDRTAGERQRAFEPTVKEAMTAGPHGAVVTAGDRAQIQTSSDSAYGAQSSISIDVGSSAGGITGHGARPTSVWPATARAARCRWSGWSTTARAGR